MGKEIDILGQTFGRLLVVCRIGVINHKTHWICKCICGNEIKVVGKNLRNGNTKSCGCYKKDLTINRNTTHGKTYTQEFEAWERIKHRCYNKKNKDYRHYGGRGIKVCDRWLKSFECFLKDMGNKPTPKMTIERINNNGDYEPSNCKWDTIQNQQRNKRNTRWIQYKGETKIITDWCKYFNTTTPSVIQMSKHKTIDEVLEYYEKKSKNTNP